MVQVTLSGRLFSACYDKYLIIRTNIMAIHPPCMYILLFDLILGPSQKCWLNLANPFSKEIIHNHFFMHPKHGKILSKTLFFGSEPGKSFHTSSWITYYAKCWHFFSAGNCFGPVFGERSRQRLSRRGQWSGNNYEILLSLHVPLSGSLAGKQLHCRHTLDNIFL